MDLFTAMTYFCRVVEAGSFSKVATEHQVAQSTVSKTLTFLEKHLGVKLMSRSTRQLSLTEAGTDYYKQCLHILDNVAEAEALVRQGQFQPSGTLKVSVTAAFGRLLVVPILDEFLQKYPKLEFNLILDDQYTDIVKEGVDIAFRVGPLADSSIIARKIGEGKRVTVASPSYLSKRGTPKTLEALAQHECITYASTNAPETWWFSGPHGNQDITVRGRFSANNPETICAASASGLGISVVMLWSAKYYLEKGDLVTLLPDYSPHSYDVHAVYPERKFTPPKVTRFIAHLEHHFALKTGTH